MAFIIAKPKTENVVTLSEQEYNELSKAKRNAEYLQMLDRSYEQLVKNQTISFSMEELQAMENENWKPSQQIIDFMEQIRHE